MLTIFFRPRPKKTDLDEDQEDWLRSLVALQSSLAKVESTKEPPKTHKPSKPKNNHKKSVKPPKDDYDNESTDSECELDLDVEDGISVQVQDELSKNILKKIREIEVFSHKITSIC